MAKCPSDEVANKQVMYRLPQIKDQSLYDHMGSSYQSNTHPNFNMVVKKINTSCIRLGEVRDVSRFLVLSEGGRGQRSWLGVPSGPGVIQRLRLALAESEKMDSTFLRLACGSGADQQTHRWAVVYV